VFGHAIDGVMVAVLLALATSGLYGLASFCGGIASRRAGGLTVAAVSQVVGVPVLALIVCFVPGRPSMTDLWWGVATGVAGAVALGLFYQALATGRISVVAPIAAAVGACLPVVVGLIAGERPGRPVLIGVALAIGAIVLIGQDAPSERPVARNGSPPVSKSRHALVLALVSGLAIGTFYICIREVAPAAGLWPLVVARVVSLSALLATTRIKRLSLRLPPGVSLTAGAAGAIDMAANACYLLAVHRGLLSVVATLASLYPAVTVVLARIVLAERLRGVQMAGIAVAMTGAAMIAAG
jgi:drug/metabolite transporter (DMT)-like permease